MYLTFLSDELEFYMEMNGAPLYTTVSIYDRSQERFQAGEENKFGFPSAHEIS